METKSRRAGPQSMAVEVHRFRSGDADAAEELAGRAMRLALRTAAALLESREEASDIAQDVAVDALRSLGKLRDPEAFDAWVHRITVRHALRWLKRRRRAHEVETPFALVAEAAEPTVPQDVDPDAVIAARQALAIALSELPPRQRLALALRYVHDLSDAEIAAALDCREGTVHALLSRGRQAPPRCPARRGCPRHQRRLKKMAIDHDDVLIRAALASARTLEPSEDEVALVIARVRPKTKRSDGVRPAIGWRGIAAPGLAALALLGAGLYSVPASRAALEDAGGTVGGVFSGWLGGDSAEAPGKALDAGETLPEYLEYLDDPHQAKEPRVIAEAGGYKLYSYIGPSGGLNFELGDTGFGTGFESAAELGKAPLFVLGPGAMQHADAEGHVPLFGVAAQPVNSVELAYESGPPLRVDGVDGGFVLLAEPSREPREVVALDSHGDVVGRQLIDNSPHAGVRIDWSKYISAAAP